MAIRIAPLDDNLDFPAPVAARQAARLGDTTTPEGKALNQTVLSGGSDMEQMGAWGSSSVAGTGATATTNFIGRLSALLGIPAFNGGNGGEMVHHHAARLGAVPAIVTIPDGVIPASGTIAVKVNNFPGTRDDRLRAYEGVLHGVAGTLAYTGGSLKFTRKTAGTAVRIPPRIPFMPSTNSYKNRFTVLWPGKNTLVEKGLSGVQEVIEYTRRMDAYTGGLGSRNMILGHVVDSGVASTSEEARAIHAVNAQYAVDYGERFLDAQALFTSRYIWYRTGISPTTADLAAQDAGHKPPSLSHDALHLNEVGYNALAIVAAEQVKALGWFPSSAIPPMPPEPAFPTPTPTPDPATGVVASDTFIGPDSTTISGRMTDSGLGGASKAWQATVPAAFGINGSTLVAGGAPGTSFAGFEVTASTTLVSARFLEPTKGPVYLTGRRDTLASPANQIRVAVADMKATLGAIRGGTPVALSNTAHAFVAGDTIGLRTNGLTAELFINNTLIETAQLGVEIPGRMVGFSVTGSGGTPSFKIDDFAVEVIAP